MSPLPTVIVATALSRKVESLTFDQVNVKATKPERSIFRVFCMIEMTDATLTHLTVVAALNDLTIGEVIEASI